MAESSAVGEHELVPDQTEGFKVGEKKTIDEYQKLDSMLENCHVGRPNLTKPPTRLRMIGHAFKAGYRDGLYGTNCQAATYATLEEVFFENYARARAFGGLLRAWEHRRAAAHITAQRAHTLAILEGWAADQDETWPKLLQFAGHPAQQQDGVSKAQEYRSCSGMDRYPVSHPEESQAAAVFGRDVPDLDSNDDVSDLHERRYLKAKMSKLSRISEESSGSSHLHANDESLRKWKESLGLGSGETILDESDPRKAIILSLGLEVQGRPDIIIDLKESGALDKLKDKPFTIKEGAEFRMKVQFRVQRQILSGMKFIQVVKRLGISSKTQEMIGSYSPNTKDKSIYEKKFETETAPSGMMARGHYNASSKFIDDDNVTHLHFNWSFDIKKDW